MNRALILVGLVPLLAVSGCAAGRATTAPAPTATTTVTVTVTATPQPSRNAAGVPGLGEWQTAGTIRARVLEINNKDTSKYNKVPDASALVEVCAQVGSFQPWWNPWNASDGNDGHYPASSSRYDDYPKPGYPFSGSPVLSEGECAKGWILFETTAGTQLQKVSYTNDRGTTMTWGS